MVPSSADVDPGAAVPLFNEQPLKLGVFNFNCSGGQVMIADSPLRIVWDEMLAVARHADELGFEAIVPIGRWRGFGGETDFNGTSFEPFTWASALAAATRRAMVFSTVHVPLLHPIVAAKMAVTIDHVSAGRFGMNLVMGWFTKEMEMFGVEQYAHDARYDYGEEWVDVVTRLWEDPEPFDVDGSFFRLRQVQGNPKPVQRRPVLLSAGNSRAGLAFAARHADFNLATVGSLEDARAMTRSIREQAAGLGRRIGVATYATIICRDTDREAQAAYDDILERGDWDGAREVMETLGIQSESFGRNIREHQARFVCGFGGHVIVGDPDRVAAGLKDLSEAGFDAVLLGFVDFVREIEYFGRRVMPVLREAGLRT